MNSCKLFAMALTALLPLAAGAAPPTVAAQSDASAASRGHRLPQVEGAWIRAAVPGQQGTGAFMRLTARQPMQLIGVETPVAGVAEVHEMKQEGDIMRMRQVASVVLPEGQAVEFKPGGYHLMLMDLKQPLKPGTRVPLTLLLRDAAGAQQKLELTINVGTHAPGGAAVPAGQQPARQH